MAIISKHRIPEWQSMTVEGKFIPYEPYMQIQKLLEQDLDVKCETEKQKTKGIKEMEAERDLQDMTENLGRITDQVVKRSLSRLDDQFDAFKSKVEKQVNEIFHSRPVLHIQIGDDTQARVLTTRASKVLPRLIANAKLKLNSLMIGPAGCGKTTAAHQVAEALGLQFGSVCLTAGASETWLFGRQTPNGFVEGMFSKIYREGGVFLADEMDAADANLLLSINTALSHDMMLNPMNGEVIKKHPSFVFIGAGNTNGKGANHLYTGRSRLDAATLDRFILINVDYDTALENELCPHEKLFKFLQEIRNGLKQNGYDEFISTRAFSAAFKQHSAGISYGEIKDSLVGNWGDGAKSIAKEKYDRHIKDQKSGAAVDGSMYAKTKEVAFQFGDPSAIPNFNIIWGSP